ncbi:MAG TPA: hypothetical protein VHY35_12655 [Stellaceae bacterium]|jgi:ParB family chromosome partitioning protein|nr:hypothetical protein [Stellaceae bacterium]
MWEIAENLHRAELTVLERSEHVAEWVRLADDKLAQVAPVSPKGGRGKEGGINAAARELGIERTDAQRATKIDDLDESAKAEAKALKLDDNQSALLAAAKAPTSCCREREGGNPKESEAMSLKRAKKFLRLGTFSSPAKSAM